MVCLDNLAKKEVLDQLEEMECQVYQGPKEIREAQEDQVFQELLAYKESRENLGHLVHLVPLVSVDLQELLDKWE